MKEVLLRAQRADVSLCWWRRPLSNIDPDFVFAESKNSKVSRSGQINYFRKELQYFNSLKTRVPCGKGLETKSFLSSFYFASHLFVTRAGRMSHNGEFFQY